MDEQSDDDLPFPLQPQWRQALLLGRDSTRLQPPSPPPPPPYERAPAFSPPPAQELPSIGQLLDGVSSGEDTDDESYELFGFEGVDWERLGGLLAEAGLGSEVDTPPARPNTTAGFQLFDPTDSPAAPSPLKARAWAHLLQAYPDQEYVRNVVGMIRHGAKIGYCGPLRTTGREAEAVPNLPMTDEEERHVLNATMAKLRAGQTKAVSPSSQHSGSAFVASPVGTVPKGEGKFRTIHHLSWPRRSGPSVNDGIDPEAVPLAYEELGPVFEQVGGAPDEGELFKVDMKDAFYHIVVASRDAPLLGFSLGGQLYHDCTLGFGGRSSPFIYNYVAEGFHWILESLGIRCSHFLDDLFGRCPKGKGAAYIAVIRYICKVLGLTISPTKVDHGPRLELLGVLVDCDSRSAWITEARKDRIVRDIGTLLENGGSCRDVQSIAGSLLFISRVCPAGRAFLRRIYDAAQQPVQPGAAKEGTALHAELKWWLATLRSWDGLTLLRPTGPTFEIWTDAATTSGIGGHLGPQAQVADVFAQPVERRHRNKTILFLETLAVVTALRKWSSVVAGGQVHLKVDNQALAFALRSGRCRERSTMSLIRDIFTIALQFHFSFSVAWVDTKQNCVADALSRFDLPFLKTNFPSVAAILPPTNHPPVPQPTDTTTSLDTLPDDDDDDETPATPPLTATILPLPLLLPWDDLDAIEPAEQPPA